MSSMSPSSFLKLVFLCLKNPSHTVDRKRFLVSKAFEMIAW